MERSGDMLRMTAIAALLAGAALFGACSDDTDAEPVATGTVAVTTPPTSAAPTTATPATTDTPTTTLDEAAALAAEVEADLRETFRLRGVAIQNPADVAAVDRALERYIGGSRTFVAERINEFESNGWVARPSESVAADIVIEVPATLIPPSSDVVEVQICEIDSWVVVKPGAGPDGGDAIVDSELYTYRSKLFLRFVDGVWRVEGADQLAQWTGLEQCPAD